MTSETAGPSAEATADELQKATEAYEEGIRNLKVVNCLASSDALLENR